MKNMWSKLKMRLPAIILLAATLLFWGVYDRYEPAGPVLLDSPELSGAFRMSGDVSRTNGVFRLHVPAGGKPAGARFHISGALDYPFIRIQGRIRTDEVVRGRHVWNSARLSVIQRDQEGRRVVGNDQLHSEFGTVEWTPQQDEFEMLPEAAEVELVLHHSGTSGTAWFDSVSVQPVKIKTTYRWFKTLFCILWLGMGFLYFRRCRLDRRRLRILILMNVIVILYGTLMPAEWIAAVPQKGKEVFLRTAHRMKTDAKPKVKKQAAPNPDAEAERHRKEEKMLGQLDQLVTNAHGMGHFILFASLCFLVYCSAALEGQRSLHYLKVAFDLLLFSGVTESLQYLTGDRTPGIHDWLLDVYGMITAFLFFLVVRAVRIFVRRPGRS